MKSAKTWSEKSKSTTQNPKHARFLYSHFIYDFLYFLYIYYNKNFVIFQNEEALAEACGNAEKD